ncbi:polysaccharide biosynthesis tyrosine autokinase [Aureimonas sp. AU40]|uniref:polysaccharide biosynthesis tyrosine autokinase n=1 Tax=Aureimonas sp. AU40 TaxID=1637747 RepID=UPI000AAA05AE|nr:polysaccharide biosynthesis tyrosine autokinase [Aureimonas sp. AU40]
MLHFPETRAPDVRSSEAADDHQLGGLIDFERILSAVRRQYKLVIACALGGLLLGVAYILTAVPVYTASADIFIDKGAPRLTDQFSEPTAILQDEAQMLSQVELLKSTHLAESVAKRLHLAENEAFMKASPSVIGRITGAVKSLVTFLPSLFWSPEIDPSSDEERIAEAASRLVRNVEVERVGRTYVLNLQYKAGTPVLAQQIAQGYADAYLDDQLEAKYDATRRAGNWLQDRIAELQRQSYDADLAVEKFRTDNNLIASNGQLVSEQQLTGVSSQLVTAKAETAEAKARYDQIRGLMESGRTDAVVNDALVSTTINSLREQYLSASRREADISAKLGANHVQAVRLRDQMKDYERLIFAELGRISESYGNAYKVALAREQSLEANLTQSLAVNADANTTQVRLRELERQSQAFKTLYETFLQRYQETIQQQSFPVTQARIITRAEVPQKASAPKKPLMLAFFTFLGIGAGTAAGAWREYRDRFFRVGDQVIRETGLEFLGYLPLVKPNPRQVSEAGALAAGGVLWAPGAIAAHTRDHPMSSFAETLRNVRIAADVSLPDERSKVIGIVSCLPSEGKSTTSSNLAVLLSSQDRRTILIDGDLRNPGLTRSLATRPETGLVETILDGRGDAAPHLLWDASGRLAVLPAVMKQRISHSSELLSSASMGALMKEARAHFDYVLVDLPPLGAIVDAKAFAHRVDAFVFVVEWGRTARHVVRSILRNNPTVAAKCLGIVLTKSDSSKMKLYRAYGSSEYYSSRYDAYYRN